MLLNIGALVSSCAFRDVTSNYIVIHEYVNECYWKDLEKLNVIWIDIGNFINLLFSTKFT